MNESYGLPTQYKFDTWQIEQGLPQNTVQAICQTRDGYLWLGTQEGLARFDGVRFVAFDAARTANFRHNDVTALCEDCAGNLWIATRGGLMRLTRGGEFQSLTIADGLSAEQVSAMCEDRRGNLWIGTRNGLNCLRRGKFVNFAARKNLAEIGISSIVEAKDGSLWVGTFGAGLKRLKNGELIDGDFENNLPDEYLLCTCEDGSGRLWIGTTRGLWVLKNGNFAAADKPASPVLSIFQDRQSDLWVGTYDRGLERLADGEWQSLTTADGLQSNSVTRVYEDREGNIWLGSLGGGLSRLQKTKFTAFTAREGLAGDNAWTIFEDGRKNVWLGTSEGLTRLKDGEFTRFTAHDGLPSNFVKAICEDKQGDLWIGTTNGIGCYRAGEFVVDENVKNLTQDVITAIYADSVGRLWIGTNGNGLVLFEDNRCTGFTEKNGLFGSNIAAILEDCEGTLWIGTSSGITSFRNGVFARHQPRADFSNETIWAICEDADGSLWFGTQGGGLIRYRRGEFSSVTMKTGLFNDSIYQILADANSNFWMSCNKGVFRVAQRELNDVADGKSLSVNCVSYDASDGMRSSECNGGSSHPAGCKTGDGKLWFPTVKGVVCIDPANIPTNDLPPPVHIEELIADGQTVDLNSKIKLAAGTKRVEFHYTALSFTAPGKMLFRYKLEGYDRDWMNAETRRAAYYTNLPPGEYRFRVAACNNDGVWNETGATLAFALQPHFYQTKSFFAVCLLGAGAAARGLYRLRLRQVEARFNAVLEERARLAREMHDTVVQDVVGISTQLEAIAALQQQAPEQAAAQFDEARRQARESVEEARRAVWNLRYRATKINDSVEILREVAEHLVAGTQVKLNFLATGEQRRLSEIVKDCLLRVEQETIVNALKHADARNLTIEVSFEAKFVRLRIADDGRGFAADQPDLTEKHHFGLTGMHERAANVGGHLVIRSAPGEGTETTLTIPIGKWF